MIASPGVRLLLVQELGEPRPQVPRDGNMRHVVPLLLDPSEDQESNDLPVLRGLDDVIRRERRNPGCLDRRHPDSVLPPPSFLSAAPAQVRYVNPSIEEDAEQPTHELGVVSS